MTTDSTKLNDSSSQEWGDSQPNVDIEIFGKNPEYQIDVYELAIEYREAKQKIESFSTYIVPFFSISQAFFSYLIALKSQYFIVPMYFFILSSITGTLYFAGGIGIKYQKVWANNLLIYSMIPCLMSFNIISIALLFDINKSLIRTENIVLYISNHHININLDEMGEYIISPRQRSVIKYLFDIPENTRLFYLERYLLRQFVDKLRMPRLWEKIQTADFRRAAYTVSKMTEVKNALFVLSLIIFMIQAIGNLTGVILWTKLVILLFFPVQFIIVSLISFSSRNNTNLMLFRGSILILVIQLFVTIIVSFYTKSIVPAVINAILIPPFIYLLISFINKLSQAYTLFTNSNIKWIGSFIGKYGILHCILRTYQKRFILSEESGWENDSTAAELKESIMSNKTDWQYNTNPKENQ